MLAEIRPFGMPIQPRRVTADRLREAFRFYDWDAAKNEVRWMCSFDTSEADIDAFVAGIREELARV